MELNVTERKDFTDLEFKSKDLSQETAAKLHNQLELLLGENQHNILLIRINEGISISFKNQIRY